MPHFLRGTTFDSNISKHFDESYRISELVLPDAKKLRKGSKNFKHTRNIAVWLIRAQKCRANPPSGLKMLWTFRVGQNVT